MSYVEDKMDVFCATASYGQLHIDSIHSLFSIGELNEDGKPKSGNNVFSVRDLSEVALFCTSPRLNNNSVLVNVEFRCTLEDPCMVIAVSVKKSVCCHMKRVDSQHVTWEEPNDLVMFRTLFNQMLSGTFEKVNKFLCGKTVHEFELEKARAIFMLPWDYTAEELKRARRLMMKVYHPDKGEEDVTRESQIINEAYTLLKSELERQEKN